MKIDRLEAHDRLKYLIEDQSLNVFRGAEDCLKRNPLSIAIQDKCPYVYIFAHPRTTDDGRNKRMLWQPRMSIPQPQTNSYLFRALSKSDIIEVIWLIPPREVWSQYQKGNVTENDIVEYSINRFVLRRDELEKPHPDDLPEKKCAQIMQEIIREHSKNLKSKPKSLVSS